MDIQARYEQWLSRANPDLAAEMRGMPPEAIHDAFRCDLAFGTGGLRGRMGAGTNRMNAHTVAKASQGLADYVNGQGEAETKSIAIGYDSRLHSEDFARVAAGVFAANGIRALLYPQLMPTPCLSYAVRALGCAAGVMITASHNPAPYNGYKVYGADGCQITVEAARQIQAAIDKLDAFDDVRYTPWQAQWIPESIYTDYVEAVKKQSVLYGESINKDVSIVYTPLNGAGLQPVLRTLKEAGFTRITVVPEQAAPDGNFPTCPYPNPEIKEAMALGIACAKANQADLLLATDPDCDRVGIAVRDAQGDYVLLSGNEVGLLLLDYICAQRILHGQMPEGPVLIKTIVTTDMAERIAARYGVRTINVLTGFKFIGEQIGYLEAQGRADAYIFGFEESYGYLSGAYVRDKDAVNGALLICEMFAHCAAQGVSLLDKLETLYRDYGHCVNALHAYTFEGEAGLEKMRGIMQTLRGGIATLGKRRVLRCVDYAQGVDGLPPSDVIKLTLAGDCSLVVRPSGTEPLLKAYVSASAQDKETAQAVAREIAQAMEAMLKG
ncbi:MAG: phospho-sugar mutase [Oscillospiraceae bacterium]|jgi:phosphoglucomutase|nr:phospho-sugar mutase [Oscillospiraceae bacterium]